ncbi:hypothetical protein ABIA99_005195 [Bradyrhizobium sp. LB12.1]|uniref:hypothetical protein n=1 Tax=Bradyrhizobium sp. LB12.1 TaxID=3156327 RepID=UPI003394050B
MFDVTPDDIAQLNDTELRELVGRLCEAELASRGLSPEAVTWGGNQTAPDGGLDVRVSLPPEAVIDGFVPRSSTGFQVKTPDMPRAAILAEMRPVGAIRPVIQELADNAGAYIIVSSHGSTADKALSNRRDALRDAIEGVTNADQLHTDFFDRTRMATWVRLHPGLITWVKEKIGRSLVGWRPYGAWSGSAEGTDAEYLVDEKLRLHLGKQREAPARPVGDAIDDLRDELAKPRTMARLVGLSGVGKTRLVQALFDPRIGSRPLPSSLAVYTNLSDNPDPQPIGLASDLIANRTRAILIVDNCPPDLHRRLSDLCAASGSTVSAITVEYDVRDDQPEGTRVVTLDTSSLELIAKLIKRRYSHISQVDAHTIAEASGGNARIAIALAETVGISETIGGLSDEDLFQRLFRQRHDPDNSLLLAAQVCSLVYSFQGEALTGEEAELSRLATLAGQPPRELYRHVGELVRRDLVQQRGAWRAVLPHAIANRLAARALEDTPYELIDQQLVTGGTKRIARSFSRRLSFLHEHPRAITIVERWLAPEGCLGDVTRLNELGRGMLENVASVSPEATLAALERADGIGPEAAAKVWRQHRGLLRSLAYDPSLFSRCGSLLAKAATQGTGGHEVSETENVFTSLFTIHLSGTHATIEQRLELIEQLLRSDEPRLQPLGLVALDKVLEATHFSSSYRFVFGARSRDYGYWPNSSAEVTSWYSAAFALIEQHLFADRPLKAELRKLLGRHFRGLWSSAGMHEELEALSHKIAQDKFWREGWSACRQTIRFDKDRLSPQSYSHLVALEAELRPSNMIERVRAIVLGDRLGNLDLEDFDLDGDIVGEEDDIASEYERVEQIARQLGASVVTDDAAFADLLPDIVRGGNRAWSFGRGLASSSPDRSVTWAKLVDRLKLLPPEQRNVQAMGGFLAELWHQDVELAQALLDAVIEDPVLAGFLPILQSAVKIDVRGVERLKEALRFSKAAIWTYRHLAYGRTTDHLTGSDLKDLILLIADQPDGFAVALEILQMRLHSDQSAQRPHELAVLLAGQELLRRIVFRKGSQTFNYNLARIAKVCLTGDELGPVAAEIAKRLKQAVADYEAYAFENDELLGALLGTQPTAVLDALFEGDEQQQSRGASVFDYLNDHRKNPADEIACAALVAWCDAAPKTRYDLAASIVSFSSRANEAELLVWTEHARALLSGAADPRSVLAVFLQRFRPTSWSGSRAVLMEANARLLDGLPIELSEELALFLNDAKDRLAREVAAERERETKHDQERDERFE